MQIERARDCENGLVLDAIEAGGRGSSRCARRRLVQDRLIGIGTAQGQEEDDDDRSAEDECVDANGDLEASGCDERDPEQCDRGEDERARRAEGVAPHGRAPTETASG